MTSDPHGPPPTPVLDGILAERPIEVPSYQVSSTLSGGGTLGVCQTVDGKLDGDEERAFIDVLADAVRGHDAWSDAPLRVEFHPGGDQVAQLVSVDWLLAGDQRG